MKKTVLGMITIGLLSVLCIGCGGPDPTKNPNFNQKTLDDPGSLKMGADAPQPITTN